MTDIWQRKTEGTVSKTESDRFFREEKREEKRKKRKKLRT